MQHWFWGARVWDLVDGAYMGEVHISSCLCCCVEPFQRHYYPGGCDSGQNFGCCWFKRICCVSAWRSACSGRSFCKLTGRWVPCQSRGVPHVWSPAAEALPPTICYICVWEPRPVLNDGILDKPFQGCRVSGLDVVSSRIAKSHHNGRPLHARPCGYGGEYCWGMAVSCVIPDKDWPQRWWR